MIFNSIRWQLQLWHGLILVGVLAGFGFTAYQFEKGRQLRQVEQELGLRLDVVMGGLGKPPAERGFRDGPPEDQFPRDNGPENYHLPAGRDFLFGQADTNGFYFLLWRRDGKILAQSANAPVSMAMPVVTPTSSPKPPQLSGASMEMTRATPPGEVMLVGRSIAPLLQSLHHFAWLLTGMGAAIWMVGMSIGWWMAARALRPIEIISGTAVKIARGDLSQRINVSDTENELGRLAGVLNSTFARLETAFALQGQFTADAAHELRTPVTVILSQTQSALKKDRDAADYKETLEACQRAAQKMRRLLESLLELARLDAGQEPMRRFQFNLSDTIRDCIELVEPLANDRGIKITAELPELPMTGDPDRLAQVFTNLLTNAIHYNREVGSVSVSLTQENQTVVVTVSDTGIGIAPGDLPNLFKRFYRADKARSGAAGQNGLGLAISKAIVEAHGGTIEASSEVGKGAAFLVRLPVVKPAMS